MTVFIDSRESIAIADAVYVENLEAWTGADIMISRLSVPCKNRTLLTKHLDSHAILTQLKVGEDLASSVGDRLNESLARMVSVTRHTASRLLLFVGTLGCDGEGSAQINGHRTHRNVSYATLDGAIVGWLARGGIYYSIPRIEFLDPWCHAMERRLIQYANEPFKYVFGQNDMPDELDGSLQIPVRVTDARRALIGFRNLGPETVNKVWAFCGGFKESLAFLTDPNSVGKLEGIGAKTIASIRKQCGLTDDDSYIGWGKDAVDSEIPQRFPNLTPVPRTPEAIAKDRADLFGTQKARAK